MQQNIKQVKHINHTIIHDAMSRVDLSIIVPCYNEEKNIPLLVKRFDKNKPSDFTYELRLVDNGSHDSTRKVIKSLMLKHKYISLTIVEKNQGYGWGILSGLKQAKGEFVCWTHADFQADILDTIKAYKLLKSSNDPIHTFVKGKRYKRAFLDSLLSFLNELVVMIILGKVMYEMNAQPNLFHKSMLAGTKPPKDWGIELYTYYVARKRCFEIKRISVLFHPRLHGQSNWNTGLKAKLDYIIRAIKFTWKLKCCGIPLISVK